MCIFDLLGSFIPIKSWIVKQFTSHTKNLSALKVQLFHEERCDAWPVLAWTAQRALERAWTLEKGPEPRAGLETAGPWRKVLNLGQG